MREELKKRNVPLSRLRDEEGAKGAELTEGSGHKNPGRVARVDSHVWWWRYGGCVRLGTGNCRMTCWEEDRDFVIGIC